MITTTILFLEYILDYMLVYFIWLIIYIFIMTVTFRYAREWFMYLEELAEDEKYLIDYSNKPLSPSFINNLKSRRKYICILLSIIFSMLFDAYFIIALGIEIRYRYLYRKEIEDMKRRLSKP